jgi:arylsulfatase A-like enzyme
VEDRRPIGTERATILRLAVWIGLIAGFLDLGLMVMKKRLVDQDFYHLGDDFVWIIPAGVVVLVLVPGMAVALFARLLRGRVRTGLAVALLAFVGLLDVSARLPLATWASGLLCGGLAIQAGRLAGSHPRAFRSLVSRTTPLLAGALLAALLATVGGRAWSEHQAVAAVPPAGAGAQNVLLIVWDTVRAGNLSLQGYSRRTTPNLDRWAAGGVRFDRAFATSSWTLPSHASLFTGRWPHELGVDWRSPLRGDVPTLAGYLSAHGYDTAGFVANLDFCGRESGLARGFAHYEDFPIDPWDAFNRYLALGRRLQVSLWPFLLDERLGTHCGGWSERVLRSREHLKNGADVSRAFLDWLSWQQGRRRPFFAFLNLNDAHSPFEVPDRSAPGFGLRPASGRDYLVLSSWFTLDKSLLSDQDVRMAVDVYDDAIAYLDRRLDRLLGELGRRGRLEDTLVIVASDHGEHLGDHHLYFHGGSLYRQLVQVPLVIVNPKGVPAGRVVAEPVSLRDVAATVVDLLGLGRDAPFPGRSLARFWDRGLETEPARTLGEPMLMETGKPLVLSNQGREPAAKGPMSALIESGMHYIRSADGLEELYLLDSDPEERVNLMNSPMAGFALRGLRQRLVSLFRPR